MLYEVITRSPVRDNAIPHGCIVAPDRYVSIHDLQAKAQCLENSSSYLVLERVIPEEGKMSRTAPRCNAGGYRGVQSACGYAREPVHMGRCGFLELCPAVQRKPAEAISYNFV